MPSLPHQQVKESWHSLDLASLREILDAGDEGLSVSEAQRRLESFGPNELPRQPALTWWQILLNQFRSPLIYILGIAALVSLATGDATDAAFIFGVLALNALIGGYQEWRAEQSTHALQKLLQIRAAVFRDRELREISADEVVPGDAVWLEAGSRVPADVRLVTAHGLEIDESLLTGESLPVLKDSSWVGEPSAPITDQENMGYAGSTVIRGRGKGLVVSTGVATAVGQLAVDVFSAAGGRPPLLERMERFSKVIAYVVLAASVVVAFLGIWLRGYTAGEMFLFSVALAVSAIPEGLPVALTVALAVATKRMAGRGVIVRRLAAVEGLGSCSMIASDKTGTLTCNELTVRELRLASGGCFAVTGEGFAPSGEIRTGGAVVRSGEDTDLESLARAAVLCNEGDLHLRDGEWVWHGDPTDVALLTMAHKLGIVRAEALNAHPQVNEIPFEPEHRFSATYHEVDGATRVYAKGAPERILAMCDLSQEGSGRKPLEDIAVEMAETGYRVLAFAEGPAPRLTSEDIPPQPEGLRFLGFVGMIDPLRPGVKDAIAACRQAGIVVSMVTGDHPVTALAIARELGFASDPEQVMTGPELEGKPLEGVRRAVEKVRVFARVAPHQKLQIVQAARASGHFVAVTGDGVNDAPALRAANIGVAMGKAGTDVARDAAELVISDDNFATIVAGVEEGRVAYDNIRKVIYLLISTGAAEVALMGLTLARGLPLPLLPVQLLWLNLVTNGIQGVALAFEPSEGGVLQRKPRPVNERIFNRLMVERTLVGGLTMVAVCFAAFQWMISAGWEEASARNILLLLMVLFENIHIGNCRSETKSAFRLSPLRSPILLGGAVLALLVHIGAMYWPAAQAVLGTEPVTFLSAGTLLLLALTVLLTMEAHKWIWRLRQRQASQ